MQNFSIRSYDFEMPEQEPVKHWTYETGAKVAFIQDASSEPMNVSVSFA